ncbi:22997_t:CDS:2 [Dentiscutata erythropus]|uniref:22997_t:CDS:1 n=1 Tax=Dentiscutata erythropus TaxID=1348616 RepID=A0A9N8YZH1_9GLOM|nr:22997_t:CDS:2 [Dentiscutata erythropus]
MKSISKLNSLPTKILISIFQYVKFPKDLAISCKKWSKIAKDWQAKLRWIVCQYGQENIIFNAVRLELFSRAQPEGWIKSQKLQLLFSG